MPRIKAFVKKFKKKGGFVSRHSKRERKKEIEKLRKEVAANLVATLERIDKRYVEQIFNIEHPQASELLAEVLRLALAPALAEAAIEIEERLK